MLRTVHKIIQLTTFLKFYGGRARRDPSIPTQAPIMLPFNIQNLHDNPGATKNSKQLGRGPGSGKGKTAGRGTKGQGARAGGGPHVRFEGGQTPLQRRIPKYGQGKRRKMVYPFNQVNLKDIDYFIKRGILSASQTITMKKLHDVGLVKRVRSGVKILGKGLERIDYAIHVQVTDASKNVIRRIQQHGGSVKLVHLTPLKLRQHLFPQKFPLALGNPITPAYTVRKLVRKQIDRGLSIEYTKPKWKIEEQAEPKKPSLNTFVYPVPRVRDSKRVRTRKPTLYKNVVYNL